MEELQDKRGEVGGAGVGLALMGGLRQGQIVSEQAMKLLHCNCQMLLLTF